jgi:hypothetical protein
MKVVDIYIACCHEDFHFRDKIRKSLYPLGAAGKARFWDSFEIEGGKDVEEEMKKRLQTAGIILLLISPNIFNDNYFHGIEFRTALDMHEKGAAVVVQIILRQCLWPITPLGNLEALPKEGKAITSWTLRDEAWFSVAKSVEEIVNKIIAKRSGVELKEGFLGTIISIQEILKSIKHEAELSYRDVAAPLGYRSRVSAYLALTRNERHLSVTDCLKTMALTRTRQISVTGPINFSILLDIPYPKKFDTWVEKMRQRVCNKHDLGDTNKMLGSGLSKFFSRLDQLVEVLHLVPLDPEKISDRKRGKLKSGKTFQQLAELTDFDDRVYAYIKWFSINTPLFMVPAVMTLIGEKIFYAEIEGASVTFSFE